MLPHSRRFIRSSTVLGLKVNILSCVNLPPRPKNASRERCHQLLRTQPTVVLALTPMIVQFEMESENSPNPQTAKIRHLISQTGTRASVCVVPHRGPRLSVQAGSRGRRHAWAVYCTQAGFCAGWLRCGHRAGRRSAPWGALMDCYLAGGTVGLLAVPRYAHWIKTKPASQNQQQ